MKRFVVISGCSGGGTSTLLAGRARRGYATVDKRDRATFAQQPDT